MRSGKRRRLILWLTLLAGVYLAFEALAWIAFYVATSEVFSFTGVAARRQAVLDASAGDEPRGERDPGGWTFEDSILHPYLGFAREPDPETSFFYGFRRRVVRPDATGPVRTVGIVGGSVAESFYNHVTASEEWAAALAGLPGFGDAPVVHVLLGLRGYKQPQQLLAVAYYLSLGGELDLLINLDGFNEVNLAGELHETGVFPAYPYHWRPLTARQITPAERRLAGRIDRLLERRRRLASRAGRLGWSVTAGTLWHLADRALAAELGAARRAALDRSREGAFPFFRVGPASELEADEFYRWSAELWARSSAQLRALADAHGFRYLHFLQPNQYVPGSKPLSALERERFYHPGSAHERHARRGYPELRAAGARLGEHFHDLSTVFEDVAETVYEDPCCHLNAHGNRLLARAVLAAVRDAAEP